MKWFYLFIAIISEVVATSTLKQSEGFSKPLPSIITVIGYCSAFYCLSIVLKEMPVGVAYAIWSGVGVMFVSLIAFFWFGQKLDASAILGIALIISGVIIINLFSKTI